MNTEEKLVFAERALKRPARDSPLQPVPTASEDPTMRRYNLEVSRLEGRLGSSAEPLPRALDVHTSDVGDFYQTSARLQPKPFRHDDGIVSGLLQTFTTFCSPPIDKAPAEVPQPRPPAHPRTLSPVEVVPRQTMISGPVAR